MRQYHIEELLQDLQGEGAIQELDLPLALNSFQELVKHSLDPHTLVTKLTDLDTLLASLKGVQGVDGTEVALYWGMQMFGETTLVYADGGNIF